jgi:hypothetical protein
LSLPLKRPKYQQRNMDTCPAEPKRGQSDKVENGVWQKRKEDGKNPSTSSKNAKNYIPAEPSYRKAPYKFSCNNQFLTRRLP